MELDNLERIQQLDTLNMLAEIDGLPDQLMRAYEMGRISEVFKTSDVSVSRVIIAGMGGSAIGADLLAAYVADICPVPVIVHRDYGLPSFARGEGTLVICSSHSGNTEETLDSFAAARRSGCRVMAVCTGGELAAVAKKENVPFLTFEHNGQPRAAVGFSFGILLAIFVKLGLIPDQADEVRSAVDAMKESQKHLTPSVRTTHNPAKRYAGQLMGRWVTIFGAGRLAPVARRMKGQINELAKAVANFEFIPEADHNALAGTLHPAEVIQPHTMNLFLRAASDHPRNRLRVDLTKQAFMLEGGNTDFLDARGEHPLAHMWTLILFGDYMAYYLAISYGVDPTPVNALVHFKNALKEKK
ncbi:MAG: bifunctional phosphoglucose/phosphomannose isomerase [Chloroflexota bacterium]